MRNVERYYNFHQTRVYYSNLFHLLQSGTKAYDSSTDWFSVIEDFVRLARADDGEHPQDELELDGVEHDAVRILSAALLLHLPQVVFPQARIVYYRAPCRHGQLGLLLSPAYLRDSGFTVHTGSRFVFERRDSDEARVFPRIVE